MCDVLGLGVELTVRSPPILPVESKFIFFMNALHILHRKMIGIDVWILMTSDTSVSYAVASRLAKRAVPGL